MNRRLTAIIIIIGLGYVLYTERATFSEWIAAVRSTPVATTTPTPSAYVSRTPGISSSPIPIVSGTAVNLDIPFTSQAPYKIWDEDHEEFCEEASVLMAASYIRGDNSITSPAIADAELYKIKAWEMSIFGYFKDTTAAESARILREYFGIAKVEVISDPTVNDIKSWLSQGRAVLVPAAGRRLGNPNFTGQGPLYHMLVIKGYNQAGQFITNDPGTRNGADYIYDTSVIMNAMHDWNGGDVDNGAKVVIVVG